MRRVVPWGAWNFILDVCYFSCATAMILLAEEECKTVTESEQLLKRALKTAESSYRKSQTQAHYDSSSDPEHRKSVYVLIVEQQETGVRDSCYCGGTGSECSEL